MKNKIKNDKNIFDRLPGMLKDKIIASDDCWDQETDLIDAIESSELIPTFNSNTTPSKMKGKQFDEKWKGIIK